MPPTIDLRSDTITQPSQAMREVIGSAPVGDDQFGEDPSVNLLQDRVAGLLGKEAALWLPTGTMANQVALRVLTRPGDDVVVSRDSHVVLYETGASAANAGVQFTAVGERGAFTGHDFLAAVKPRGHVTNPPTTLVAIENTHNRAGGVVFPQADARRVCEAAAERDIASYMDGARLWNAAAASGRSLRELAAPFDLVSVALSKGLGAPGGSLLAGSTDLIHRCVRYRRMLGGAMRQVGHLAAAGLYALDNNVDRLAEDHANVRAIAERIAPADRIAVDWDTVQTNILIFGLSGDAPDAQTLVDRARERGVLMFAFGHRTVRVVTHLDVSREECERAAEVILDIAG